MGKRTRWIAVAMVAVLLLAAVAAWLGSGRWRAPARGDKPPAALDFAAAEVVQPTTARLPTTIEFSGPLVAPQTAVVRAKAAGTLLALDAAEGRRVRAGEVIGRIDIAETKSRVAERDAHVASARATLAQAERTHASNERLATQRFISPIALENSRAALDTARATVEAAEASLAAARVGLRDATLVAPIGGIVAKRHVLPGEKVGFEQTIVTIVDLARLELAGSVATHVVSRLAAGMPVDVVVEGHSSPVAGRIERIAPAAEPGTRSIGVIVGLANRDERLRAGQYAVARAVLADDRDRLTLPIAAVADHAGQAHVWVVEDGKLARRAVTIGLRDERGGRVEVLGGLTAAAQVLAARFDNLREGAPARVVGARSAAPLASSATSAPTLAR